jgi:hypothetical protein
MDIYGGISSVPEPEKPNPTPLLFIETHEQPAARKARSHSHSKERNQARIHILTSAIFDDTASPHKVTSYIF